jgi:hypothetical protein
VEGALSPWAATMRYRAPGPGEGAAASSPQVQVSSWRVRVRVRLAGAGLLVAGDDGHPAVKEAAALFALVLDPLPQRRLVGGGGGGGLQLGLGLGLGGWWGAAGGEASN